MEIAARLETNGDSGIFSGIDGLRLRGGRNFLFKLLANIKQITMRTVSKCL
jgi:hypothetical protein